MNETFSLKDILPYSLIIADIWVCLSLSWHDYNKMIMLNEVFFSKHQLEYIFWGANFSLAHQNYI